MSNKLKISLVMCFFILCVGVNSCVDNWCDKYHEHEVIDQLGGIVPT